MISYRINGKTVSKREWDRRKGRGLGGGAPMGTLAYSESKPLVSEALGCMKHQVPEMRQAVERAGLSGVRVLKNGAVEITTRGERGRRGLLKMRGLHDAEAGYGDW